MSDLQNIMEELMKKEEVKIENIPSIDLYMDQVLTIFEKYFPYNKGEQVLTKTMINNYAKDGIIKPAVKKKYSREHVLMIIITCMLKRSLSLSEIKRAIDQSDNVESSYGKFLSKKDTMNSIITEHLSGILARLKDDEILGSEDNKMLNVLVLSYYSNILSEAARAILSEELND